MPRRLAASFLLLSILLPALAEEGPGVVRRGKAATALVVTASGRGFGSAFCIDAAGFFVTNEHVVRGLPAGRALSLVLHPGDDDEKVVRATVVRSDVDADLALLKVEGVKGLTVLELGDVTGLEETAQVTAFGYPFGDLLAVKGRKYPSISVNVGRITALRKEKKQLTSIQLDAALNPGNSGGPVLDAKGKVIGIVRAGVRGAGVNVSIPVTRLEAFLDRPEVAFAPPPIAHARRHVPTEFTIRLVSFGKAKAKSVEVALVAGASERKFLPAAGKGHLLLHRGAGPAPRRRPASTPEPDLPQRADSVRRQGPDVRAGQEDVPPQRGALDRQREADDRRHARRRGGVRGSVGAGDGARRAGRPQRQRGPGQGAEDRRRGSRASGRSGRIYDQRAAGRQGRQPPGWRPRDRGPASHRLAGRAGENRASDAGGREDGRPPACGDRAACGGGRYLVLHLKRPNKLAVFDVAEAKVVRYLPAPAGDFLFAASAEKLVVVVPGKKLLERWDLRTFEKERSVPLPVDFAPARIALGSQSAGPLLLWAPVDHTALIGLDTLKKLAVPLKILGRVDPHGLEVEACPDGSAFTVWFRRQHTDEPSRFGLFRLHGDTVTSRHGLSLLAPCHASIDGGPVFTGDGNVYTGDMKRIDAPALKGATLLPVQNSYVVAARWEGKERKARLAVHLTSDLKEAFKIGKVEELDGLVTDPTDPNLFGYDRRIHLLPSAGVLLTIPATNDQIVVRKLDVEAALKKSALDYLFVASVQVRRAVKGAAYAYQVEVKSKKGKVVYRLDSGPEGMRISAAGKLTWAVPADFGEDEASVVLSIRDASGQEVFHAFGIRCR